MNYTAGELTKAINTLVVSVLAVVVAGLGDGSLDGLELIGTVVALLSGVAVFLTPNAATGPSHYAKAIVGGIGTALTVFVTSLAGNAGVPFGDLLAAITPVQWLTLLMGVLTAVTTALYPNAPVSTLANGLRVRP